MGLLIGIDVGSSATKVGLFAENGKALAVSSSSYPTEEPSPGYKEQDPELWWRAAVDGIRHVLAGSARERIDAIAVVGHISSFTFVDANGVPLRPAIGFQDQRAITELEQLYGTITRRDLALHLRIDLPPAATWPLPKLLWLQRHEPGTLEGAHCLLQAKDFVNFRLTGVFASDPSSNRGMIDFETNRVSEPVFSAFGLSCNLIPPLFAPEQVIGAVSAQAARETTLEIGIPVMAGWNDLNACVLGSGAVESGEFFDVAGTSEQVGVITEQNHDVRELICAPFLPGKKLLYGVTSSGGGSLDWYSRASAMPVEKLIALAEDTPAACEDLIFLPYLEGERAPIWDAYAAGAFVGLRTRHHQGHFVRAILEGVAFSLLQVLQLLGQHTICDQPIVISGGPSRIKLWNQIKADAWQRRTCRLRNPQAGVLGAAILAAVGSGKYETLEAAARTMAELGDGFEPDPLIHEQYWERYERFCALYKVLQPWFSRAVENTRSGREVHV